MTTKKQKTGENTTAQGVDVQPMVIYRCGWCGLPTDESGEPLDVNPDEYLEENKTAKEELINGCCCMNQHQPQRMQVTREMAMDAGEPDMEGMWM